jgi:iron complex transport system substrate-binding protein
MSRPLPSRRHLLGGFLGAAAAAGLAACGSDSDGGSDSGSGDNSGKGKAGSAGRGSFPAKVEHRFGSTTVPKAPSRAVSNGYVDHDALLALGVVPLGIRQWDPKLENGVGAWAHDALKGQRPKLFVPPETPFEKIAALGPDLIVNIGYAQKKDEYAKLSKIAPTLASPKGYADYSVPWEVLSQQVGDALGRGPEMKKKIAAVNSRFAAAKRKNPGFAGRTANIMMATKGEDGQYGPYASTDLRGRFMTKLGFSIPEKIEKLAGGKFYAAVSDERLDLLEADVLVVLGGIRPDDKKKLAADKSFQNLKAVKEGRMVYVDSYELSMAVSASSIMSLPFALDGLVPLLAKAVAKR